MSVEVSPPGSGPPPASRRAEPRRRRSDRHRCRLVLDRASPAGCRRRAPIRGRAPRRGARVAFHPGDRDRDLGRHLGRVGHVEGGRREPVARRDVTDGGVRPPRIGERDAIAVLGIRALSRSRNRASASAFGGDRERGRRVPAGAGVGIGVDGSLGRRCGRLWLGARGLGCRCGGGRRQPRSGSVRPARGRRSPRA